MSGSSRGSQLHLYRRHPSGYETGIFQLAEISRTIEHVFEAFKFIEKEVKRISGVRGKIGHPLMMDAFNENSPKVQLNGLATESAIDEQMGFKFIFVGAATGIRNPRGHEVDIGDTLDEALDYLALASCCAGLTPLASASSPMASRERRRAGR